MKGIELARQWFEQYGFPELKKRCPEILPRLAIGIAGHGSECFGYDDEFSRDHDFSAGISLWCTEADEAQFGFLLSKIYAELCKAHPLPVHSPESLGAQPEQGVTAIEEFFRKHIGLPGVPQTWQEWLYTPEYAFAESVNGAVFYDGPGIFTAIRKEIASAMPEDVWLKKLSARAALMAQTGQYNFSRCLQHHEPGAAHLALAEFVRNTISIVFLLNHRFAPYYKWMFRALRELPKLGNLADPLEFLLVEDAPETLRAEMIEEICARIVQELQNQQLSDSGETYLEPHAVAIMKKIRNQEIRSLHLMEG